MSCRDHDVQRHDPATELVCHYILHERRRQGHIAGLADASKIPDNGVVEVKVWQVNISKTIIVHVPITHGEVQETGDFVKGMYLMMQYELPENLLGIIWKGQYRGQKQKWFITRFTGNESEINLKTKNPEFIEWKWIETDDLPNVIVDFKKKVYLELVKEIKKLTY